MALYLTLLRQFILRGLTSEKTRASTSVLGIALGVAVMLAVRLANQSSLESFRTAIESVAGGTSLEIEGVTGRFDELLVRDLHWLGDYGTASPIIEEYACLPGGQYLRLLGTDILRDRALRHYRLLRLAKDEREEVTATDFLRLLIEPDAIVLTERLAKLRGWSIGDSVHLQINDHRVRFTIRGLLLDEGPARAFNGYFGLLDIAAAQAAFGCYGLLDRLDVKLHSDFSLEEVVNEVRTELPPGLRVRTPGERYRQVKTLIASFHFNLTALGSLALLVGLFLIYNTSSFSVIRRRREIGMLRAIGASQRMIFGLFLGEAFLLALPGTCIGVPLGELLASGAVRTTASTVETFYIAEVARETAEDFTAGTTGWLLAFAIAIPLSLLAAFLPAWEASRISPAAATGDPEKLAAGKSALVRQLILSAVLCVAAYILCLLEPVGNLPLFAYLAVLCLVFAGAFLVPFALRTACQVSERCLFRHLPGFRVEGLLATTNLRGATYRVSVTVAALTVSLAMTVAIAIMVGSFRQTVIYWLDQTLRAQIFVRPATITSGVRKGSISKGALEIIRSDPDVVTVDTLIRRDFSHQGHLITLGARKFAVLLDHGRMHFKSPAGVEQRVRWAKENDGILVSESFSLRFGKRPGDLVELDTRSGTRTFKVAAVFYDYSNNRGAVLLDLDTYGRYFAAASELKQPSDLAIYLTAGAHEERVKDRLVRATSERYQLFFRSNKDIRERSLKIFDSTFTITYALQVIAITVAALGVVSTLITLIFERRKEISVLRFLGTTRRQVRKVVILEALLIGAVSQTIGIVVGCLLALILIFVINVQSFNWTIHWHLPVGYLLQSTCFVLLAAVVASLYPAARVSKVPAIQPVCQQNGGAHDP